MAGCPYYDGPECSPNVCMGECREQRSADLEEPEQSIEDYCSEIGHVLVISTQGAVTCLCGAYGVPTGPPVQTIDVKEGLL